MTVPAAGVQMAAVLHQHSGWRPNRDSTRIRCLGCKEVLEAVPDTADVVFAAHLAAALTPLAQELDARRSGDWTEPAKVEGGYTELELFGDNPWGGQPCALCGTIPPDPAGHTVWHNLGG